MCFPDVNMLSLLLRSLAAGKLSGFRKEGDCYDFAIAKLYYTSNKFQISTGNILDNINNMITVQQWYCKTDTFIQTCAAPPVKHVKT